MVELLGFLLLATLERVLYKGKREGDGERSGLARLRVHGASVVVVR